MRRPWQRMPFKYRWNRRIAKFRRRTRELWEAISWLDTIFIVVAIGVGMLVFHKVKSAYLKAFDSNSVLSNLLVINGVFSAVLMTYLFSRIGWVKDRKLETYNEAMAISQKITDFRRILYILTRYYNVWDDDKKTKSLLEHSKYSSVEYWELRGIYGGGNSAEREALIEELIHDPNYDEGKSNLYLAMLSLVYLRGREEFNFQNELYHEFDVRAIYTLKIVNRWIDYDYFGQIWYWMNRDVKWIRYYQLGESERNKIIEAAGRINPKLIGEEVTNDTIEVITEAFTTHYLSELQGLLFSLKKGNLSLNLLITVLICCSLFFGILLPLLLLLFISKDDPLYQESVVGVASVNAAIIFYFIIKFPFLISRELKFI